MRILLVEDDTQLGSAIVKGLRQEYAADWFCNAEEADAALAMTPYDAVVLDINLPGMSGIEWLVALRKQNHVIPVILLTAYNTLSERVSGLDSGADDYLAKPFDFEELLARIRALARRQKPFQPNVIRVKDITLDRLNKIAFREEHDLGLSQKEFDILHLLLVRRGHCVSKERIEQSLYSWDDDISSNTVEVHISRLRRKLGKPTIQTIRNLGYKIE